jgi:uncharacterized membrane protein YbhN (UPF0104 family)
MVEPATRMRWIFALKLLISVTLVGAILIVVDLAAVLAVLSRVDPWVFVAAVGLAFCQILLAGVRWHALGRRTGVFVGPWSAMRIMFAAMFANQFLPTSIGGDFVRIGLLARHGVLPGRAARTVVLDRLTGLISLMTLMMVTGFVLGAHLPTSWPVGLIRALPVAAIIVALLGLLAGDRLASVVDRWPRLDWVARLFRESSLLLRGGGTAVTVLVLSYGIHATSAACVWVLAQGTGVMIDYLSVLGFLPIVILVQLIPISIAGWGVREGTIVTLFALLGIASAPALVVSILWGAATAVSAMGAGLIWLISRPLGETLPDQAPTSSDRTTL